MLFNALSRKVDALLILCIVIIIVIIIIIVIVIIVIITVIIIVSIIVSIIVYTYLFYCKARPDITVTVGSALKINYLSIYL